MARDLAFVEAVVRDVRMAARRLRRAPVFAAGVVGTIAVGVAAAIGIGQLVFAVLLKPLPYADPGTIARVDFSTPGLNTVSSESSDGLFLFFRERSRSFASLGAYYMNPGMTITDGEFPERAAAGIVTPRVLGILGVRPVVGRLFGDEDARVQVFPILISHDLWVRRFGRDPAVVGKTMEVNRATREIVGVLPQGFAFPAPGLSVWFPTEIKAKRATLDYRYFRVIGRLRDGVSTEQAEAEFRTLIPLLSERFPETTPEAVRASGLAASIRTLKAATVDEVRTQLTLLGIMVLVVLLIATANVATLFLLRSERLRGEVAVSTALGAGWGDITRRFVAEGLVVGVASGIVALPLVAGMILAKFGFSAAQIPRLHEVTLTPGVVIVVALTAVLLGGLLGVVAAARVSGAGVVIGDEVRGGSRATGDRGWQRVQRSLVVLQVASALVLLLGAGLLGQSLWRLSRVDVGFTTQRALTFEIGLPFGGYSRYQLAAARHLGIVDALAALPNVRGATAAMGLPFDREISGMLRQVTAEGERGPASATARPNIVAASYFETMGIPIRSGRAFAPGDLATPTPAVILSAALARELFRDTDPVGREIQLPDPAQYPAFRVVGVVGDVYGERIQDGPTRTLYFPLVNDLAAFPIDPAVKYKPPLPYNPTGMHFVIDTDAPMATLLPAIRRIVRDADAKVPVANAKSMREIVAVATAQVRLTMVLLATAAAAALLLSAIGLYSVIAYAVAGRRREFGVRLAVGATPEHILTLVLRESLTLVSAGIALGVILSLATSRLIRGVLFEVSPTSPAIYALGAVLVLLIAVASTYLPARAASRTDPAHTLRSD